MPLLILGAIVIIAAMLVFKMFTSGSKDNENVEPSEPVDTFDEDIDDDDDDPEAKVIYLFDNERQKEDVKSQTETPENVTSFNKDAVAEKDDKIDD